MTKSTSALRAWAVLMALSALLAALADLRYGARLGPLMILAVGAVALLKSYVILADYMALRAHAAMLSACVGAIALVLAIVCGVFILFPP